MFAHIKAQVRNPGMPQSGFTLDQIMHLHINFDKLGLVRGSIYTELPKRTALKKEMINPKNNDEQCFKCVVIATLLHEEIDQGPHCTSKLQNYEDQHNWRGLKFPLALQKIGKFEKSSPDIAVKGYLAAR